MKRRTFNLTLAVSLALGLLWCAHPSISAAFKNVQPGQPPPAFSLKDLSGKEWRGEDLYGRGVQVMVFWATWSPRSLEILRDLEGLRSEVGADKFQLVTVNCEHPQITAADRGAIGKLAAEVKLSGPVLVDDGLVAFNDFGAMALPSTLVVGPDGKVAYLLSGYPTTLRADLGDAIRKAAGLPTEAEQRPVQEYVPKNHALMYYNLGRRLREKGQDEKALEQLTMAVERDPDFKKPHAELGLLHKQAGRREEALREFQRLKELDPHDHEAGYQLAVLNLQAGKLAEGEKLFQELLTEFPEREEFALGLALAQKYQGREGDAAKTRAEAARLSPAEARYVYEMGGIAESQKDLAEAAGFYRRALEEALRAQK